MQSLNLKRINLCMALVCVSVLTLLPILSVLGRSIYSDGAWHIADMVTELIGAYTVKVLVNSLLLGVYVTLLATLFAAPLAWITSKTEIGRHSHWLDILILIPFMTPPFIDSMGWMIFMQPNGYLQQLLPNMSAIPWLQSHFFSLFGMVLIMSLSLFPFMYLVIKNSLLRISTSLEEAAQIYGASRAQIIIKVFLPLVMSGYIMGALLVFVKTISEFGTPATLGKEIGYYVLTTEIHRFTSTWPVSFEKAAMLSTLLLMVSMGMWALQLYISKPLSISNCWCKGESS